MAKVSLGQQRIKKLSQHSLFHYDSGMIFKIQETLNIQGWLVRTRETKDYLGLRNLNLIIHKITINIINSFFIFSFNYARKNFFFIRKNLLLCRKTILFLPFIEIDCVQENFTFINKEKMNFTKEKNRMKTFPSYLMPQSRARERERARKGEIK